MELVRLDGDDDQESAVEAHALPPMARLGLREIERRSVEELVIGIPGATADFVSQRAAAFAVDESGHVRRRSLSKAAAVQEALASQLSALLAAAVARRDAAAVKLLDRALSGSTKRFTLLLEELRAEISGGRRAVVQVGVVANNVNISGQR